VALFGKSLKNELVGAEEVKGVKIVVADEALVALVATVELVGGPGVHTSCSNDRLELAEQRPASGTVSTERRWSALNRNRWWAFLMPDLDGGGYCPPLYGSRRFSSQVLGLDPF
jgi:hypothetical protein